MVLLVVLFSFLLVVPHTDVVDKMNHHKVFEIHLHYLCLTEPAVHNVHLKYPVVNSMAIDVKIVNCIRLFLFYVSIPFILKVSTRRGVCWLPLVDNPHE